MDEKKELVEELIRYQELSETTIQKLNTKIVELENKLNMFSSVLSISEYINQCLGNEKILLMVNDVLMGVLGAEYSTIYIKEKGKLQLKDTNLKETVHHMNLINSMDIDSYQGFLSNSEENLCRSTDIKVHSSLGMPISLKDEVLGYIVVEHESLNYFNDFHVKFIRAICNHIAICFENNKLYNRIKEISNRDFLTGLFNRNYFYQKVSRYLSMGGKDIAIAMLDFDDFKNCNDNYGHLYGDYVLTTISRILKENLEEPDIVCRYGGEEIIICLHNINDIKAAENEMNRIRKLIESEAIIFGDISEKITVSIGVSILEPEDRILDDVIKKADNMLYVAKRTGKNKVMAWNIGC